MVTLLANETNDILQTTNLLNKCPMYTTENKYDSQTLRNYENFIPILNDAVKDNVYRIHIYININNLHFKPSFKPERFENISEEPLPISELTSGYGNIKPGTGPGTQHPSINIPQNVVTAIEEIYK